MKEHAKKALKHDTKVLGKTVPTMLIIGLFLVGGGSAALLSTFGTVTGTADVEQSVKVEGPETVSYQGGFVADATKIDTFNVTNDATQSAEVTYSTDCSATIDVSDDRLQTDSSNCDGVNRRAVAYYDSAGADFTGYSAVESPNLEVGEDGEYGSVGAAVADASSGDTILVHGGEYDPFTVNKSDLKVVAANAPDSDASGSEGSADIRGAPNGIEVTEEASGATVKGFNIDVSEEKETDSRGILVKASEVTVDSNYVNGVRAKDRAIGIYVFGHHDDEEGNDLHAYNVDDTTVINNKVEDVKASGLSAGKDSYPPRAEGIVITENDGDGNSADSVSLIGNTITEVGENNPGISAAIAVDGGNAKNFVIKSNEISDIEHKDAPNYPYDLGIHVTGYDDADGTGSEVIEKNNFLMSTSDDVDVALPTSSTTNLNADNNWFGENGKQVSSTVTASYEKVTDQTLSAGETDTVGIYTNFDVALAPGDYTVDFDVSPQSAS